LVLSTDGTAILTSIQALVTAKLNERYSVLRESTRALVFFGTPHRGGNNVSLGKVAANIVVSVSGAANNNIMDYLAKNSLLSQQANEDFGYQVHNYRVVTFFERLPTKLKGVGSLGNHIRAMVVEEESAKLGCTDEILIAVDSDHTNLNKFWGRDHFYEAVGGKLRDLMRHCLESAAQAQSVPVPVKGGFMNAIGRLQLDSMKPRSKVSYKVQGLAFNDIDTFELGLKIAVADSLLFNISIKYADSCSRSLTVDDSICAKLCIHGP
jgi:hypothetical protein